jgi:hypothetical protein
MEGAHEFNIDFPAPDSFELPPLDFSKTTSKSRELSVPEIYSLLVSQMQIFQSTVEDLISERDALRS